MKLRHFSMRHFSMFRMFTMLESFGTGGAADWILRYRRRGRR
jgi:hypothetical protein